MARILHVLGSYLPVTQHWIEPQVREVPGFECGVMCDSLENTPLFPTAEIATFVREPGNPTGARSLRQRLLKRSGLFSRVAHWRAARWKPALIHAHFGMLGLSALPFKRSLGVPLVTTFYGYDAWMLPTVSPSWLDRYGELWSEGERFLVEGPAMRERLIAIGCPPGKITVRRLGVDAAEYPDAKSRSDGSYRIAMIGRFTEKKGFPVGLQACLNAAARQVDLFVTIIGDASSGDRDGEAIKRQLLAMAADPALKGRVAFTGFLSPEATRKTLTEQNILLCPSKHAASGDAEGGMPFVLAEAMAMGIVGIGSRHCDMQELISDGETGFLFEESDVDGLSEILIGLPKLEGRLEIMRARARRHILDQFDLRRQLQALSDVYRYCIEGHTKGDVESK